MRTKEWSLKRAKTVTASALALSLSTHLVPVFQPLTASAQFNVSYDRTIAVDSQQRMQHSRRRCLHEILRSSPIPLNKF